MCDLAIVIPAAEVTDAFRAQAETWGIWDSSNEPKAKFPYSYPMEERVLIISGKATLKPDGGSPAFDICAGEAVTFRAGFKCKWHVTEPMTKHFQLFEFDGTEVAPEPSIACDACGCECFAESYFVAFDAVRHEEAYEQYGDGDLAICPKCLKKARGAEKKRFAGAERQVEGEAVPTKPPAAKKPRKN